MQSKPYIPIPCAFSAALLFCLILVLLPCGAQADTYTVRQSLREDSPELIFDLNYLPEGDYFYTDLITVRHPDGSFSQQIPLDPKA